MLAPHRVMQLAVAIMIFAGLRRAETLWLAPSSIAPDLSYLSVTNRVDSDQDIENSLKTGARTVSILPALRAVLTTNQAAGAARQWLVSTPKEKRGAVTV